MGERVTEPELGGRLRSVCFNEKEVISSLKSSIARPPPQTPFPGENVLVRERPPKPFPRALSTLLPVRLQRFLCQVTIVGCMDTDPPKPQKYVSAFGCAYYREGDDLG